MERSISRQLTVIVAWFGDQDYWNPYVERAVRSVEEQTVQVPHMRVYHPDRLDRARNLGLEDSETEFIIWLDADDELSKDYCEKMLWSVAAKDADVLWPSTLGVHDGVEDQLTACGTPQHNFLAGNHIGPGALVRRVMGLDVGGVRDLPILEDWDFYIRMFLMGARMRSCPEAIYRMHVREQSRNQHPRLHGQVYQEIQNTYREYENQLVWQYR